MGSEMCIRDRSISYFLFEVTYRDGNTVILSCQNDGYIHEFDILLRLRNIVCSRSNKFGCQVQFYYVLTTNDSFFPSRNAVPMGINDTA